MKFDFHKELNQGLASLDQRLQVFKEYYLSLDFEQRSAIGRWVRRVSAPFPDDFDEFMCMQCHIGLNEDRGIEAEIEVRINGKAAKALPQHLRQAVAAWERGEEFVPPASLDYT
ncbi:MAG TPA: hypothetical protein VH120_10905 [Gemmataceae bacterium]|nr:hypothetical protein [Gemmataceae bacterium]